MRLSRAGALALLVLATGCAHVDQACVVRNQVVRDRHTATGAAVAALVYVVTVAAARGAVPRVRATPAQALSYAGIGGLQVLLVAGCGAVFGNWAFSAGPSCRDGSTSDGSIPTEAFVALAAVLSAICVGGWFLQRLVARAVPRRSSGVLVTGVLALVLAALVAASPPLLDPLGGRALTAALLATCGLMTLAVFAREITWSAAATAVAVLFGLPGALATVGYATRGECTQAGTTYDRDLDNAPDQHLRTTARLCVGPGGAVATVSAVLSGGTTPAITTASVVVTGRGATNRCQWDVSTQVRCRLDQHGPGSYAVIVEFGAEEPFTDEREAAGPLVTLRG